MSCTDDQATAAAALLAALQGPLTVTGDAGSVTQHNLKDLIELDKYLASKCAVTPTRPSRGLRITRLILPGTV